MKMPEPEGTYIPTLNRKGYMTTGIDQYSQEFINYSASCSKPVLDIGVAYGITTIAALEKGATVFANDMDSQHLKILENRVPSSLKKQLQIYQGRFPDDLSFEENSFNAILATRILHFLTGEELEKAVSLAAKWLTPGGKFFVVSDTPYAGYVASRGFLPIYFNRRANNEQWPGEIFDIQSYFTREDRKECGPDYLHLADIDVMARVFLKSKLIIEKISYINRTDYPEDSRYDGRESMGIIGVKSLS